MNSLSIAASAKGSRTGLIWTARRWALGILAAGYEVRRDTADGQVTDTAA